MTKVAIVTGANKGLGLAIVKGLCDTFDGIVYLTSRDESRGREACKDLEKLGLKPAYHQLDVTDTVSVTRFYNYICTQYGRVDVLVNNAGILFLNDATEPRIYQAEQTIKVNFHALVTFCETMLPLVSDGAKIVNVSSSSGHLSRIPSENLRAKFKSSDLALKELIGLMDKYVEDVKQCTNIDAGWGDSPYVISKVGVNAYSFMLHRRLSGRDIKVNSVHPGYVISDMTRGAGSVTPAQAAVVVLRLALEPSQGGLYVWHDGTPVSWDGPDPRQYIDGKTL